MRDAIDTFFREWATRPNPEGLTASDAFQREYTVTYGYASDEDLELVNVRCVATGLRRHRLDFRDVRVATEAPAPSRRRPVHFARGAPAVDTPVVARDTVTTDPAPGPLIVESYDSTVVVPPGASIARDAFGNLVITIMGGRAAGPPSPHAEAAE